MENQPAHDFAESMMPLLRSALLGDLTASFLHEVNNPLTAILNYARLQQMGQFRPEEKDEFSQGIVAEGERISVLSNLLARLIQPEEEGAYLHEALDLALHLYATRFRHDGIVVEYQSNPALMKTKIHFAGGAQILLLVFEKIRRDLQAQQVSDLTNKTIRCAWHSTGLRLSYNMLLSPPPPPINLLTHFFSHLPQNESTQLGLAMTQAVLQQADCKIALTPQPEGWTEITLEFLR